MDHRIEHTFLVGLSFGNQKKMVLPTDEQERKASYCPRGPLSSLFLSLSLSYFIYEFKWRLFTFSVSKPWKEEKSRRKKDVGVSSAHDISLSLSICRVWKSQITKIQCCVPFASFELYQEANKYDKSNAILARNVDLFGIYQPSMHPAYVIIVIILLQKEIMELDREDSSTNQHLIVVWEMNPLPPAQKKRELE